MDRIDSWLEDLFAPTRREHTITLLHEADPHSALATQRAALSEKLKVCETKLARYREALESGTDPDLVAAWTAQVIGERARLTVALERLVPTARPSRKDLHALLYQMSSLAECLRRADPHDRADLYLHLGLQLRYEPTKREVRALISPDPCSYESVRGASWGSGTRSVLSREFVLG
ncbi:hypothetical protein [Kineosporia succinea]|uniref:Uncharacterized protein n=1 Tax=Kineosporia succinea TaxID=84632 RepID=A0ABT9P8H8_9ACTN|nr:hypothetical protein [Kineosporia succinea]MDP9829001.1 hypothetical protein [Kineosporia succinea]